MLWVCTHSMRSGTLSGNIKQGNIDMKKAYEQAEMNIIVFDNSNVIVASTTEVFEPSYIKGNDETEIL